MTNQTERKLPSHNIFVKVYKGVESKLGSKIGVAFAHRNGEGFNAILDAIPISTPNGQLELVFLPNEPVVNDVE